MYFADLHIHSRYSRATSRECTPEHLDFWARRKGIGLLGTGDFTHPAWREELAEKLLPDAEGLYRLKPEFCLPDTGLSQGDAPRFVLSGEISSIYKKNGRVRKVHNVILLPSLEAAEALSRKLEAIGNIHSDGRPILGLDSRDLLELTLSACPEAIFIPAHIWTPHFSLFGAFSGFDTIEECFEDLTPHIHALETGLSSDPPMNWRVSALDRYHLVSNSDAHSPQKLGREANLIGAECSYPGLKRALEKGAAGGLLGTVEFFPEEGKYHYDGHRNCGCCLKPSEAIALGDLCPVCGKKLTIGVEHRVEALADRPEGYQKPGGLPFEHLAPLPEVIAASTGYSPASVKTAERYERMLRALGPEFYILREAPLSDIGLAGGPCMEEGIRRLRAGQVLRSPGYDGAYGTIGLLTPSEIESLNGQTSLFGVEGPSAPKKKTAVRRQKAESIMEGQADAAPPAQDTLNEDQTAAVMAQAPAVAVVAGPGTGKTKTLVARIVHLVRDLGVKPEEITAVTFTNQAAAEMRERLQEQLPGKRSLKGMRIGTFHALCLAFLTRRRGGAVLLSEADAREAAAGVLRELDLKGSPQAFLQAVSRRKSGLEGDLGFSEEGFARYKARLSEAGVLDFDDLLLEALAEWEAPESRDDPWKSSLSDLLVDEFQDVNPVQERLLSAWGGAAKRLFVIGDPDQSIYGFRGSDAVCFGRLLAERPELRTIRLKNNYRSTPQILGCALSVISHNPGGERSLFAQREAGAPVCLAAAGSALSEGIFVAKEINRQVGGLDMLEAGTRGDSAPRSFSDFAVLYRTHHQAELLEKCLRKEGVPYVVRGRDDWLETAAVRGVLAFFRFLSDVGDRLSLAVCLRTLWNCPEDLLLAAGDCAAQAGEDVLSALCARFSEIPVLEPFLHLCEVFLPRVGKDAPLKLLRDFTGAVGLKGEEAVERLLNTAVFYRDLDSFLETLLLGTEGDLVRSPGGKKYASGAVSLMTLHGAKGLEFPVVFLCGLNKGTLPLERVHAKADPEEERRLFYVGMTRAREALYLLAGGEEPSPFAEELPMEALKRVAAGGGRKPAKQLTFF